MAAAAAAGLNRNGIRRTAFSTGDLQALSVLPNKNSPSPPDPANVSLHRYRQNTHLACQCSTRLTQRTAYCCSLAVCCWDISAQVMWLMHTVVTTMSAMSHPHDDVLYICRTISSSSVSAQPSLATVPEGSTINMGMSAGMPALQYSSETLVQTEDLSSMSVEELQAELIRTRQAFHSAGCMPFACCFCC